MTPLIPTALTDRNPPADAYNFEGKCWYGANDCGQICWQLLDSPTCADTHWLPWWAIPAVP